MLQIRPRFRAHRLFWVHAVLPALACLAMLAHTNEAEAQYRNRQFQVLGGLSILLPSNDPNYYRDSALVDPPSGSPTQAQLPDGRRFARGLPYSTFNASLELDFLFKVSLDSWWIKGGIQLGLIGTLRDPTFPQTNGNTAVWLELNGAPRYYFLTDRIRPFAEIGLRVATIVGANDLIPTKLKVFPGIYGALGLEIIVVRDIAISIQGRYTRFLTLNWPGFNDINALAGVNLYF